MKKTAFLLLVIVLLATGCWNRGAAENSSKTATMAPAAPTGTQAETTDPMTQTVSVEDGRSVDEGAYTNAGTDTAAAATSTSAKPAKAPSKKSARKH